MKQLEDVINSAQALVDDIKSLADEKIIPVDIAHDLDYLVFEATIIANELRQLRQLTA